MLTVRRTKYALFRFDDEPVIRLDLSRAEAKATTSRVIYVAALLTGAEWTLTQREFEVLLQIPSDRWIPVDVVVNDRLSLQHLHSLVDKGLVLTDDADEHLADFKRRDEGLTSGAWNLYAAAYHLMGRSHYRGARRTNLPNDGDPEGLTAASRQMYGNLAASFGRPPAHFYSVADPGCTVNLPLIEKRDEFYQLLAKRRTTRAFDTSVPLKLEELSLILYYVFGCHGYVSITDDLVVLKRTSPSGGSLHSIEVYPLVLNVAAIQRGLYHYSLRNHSLELVTLLGRKKEAMDLAYLCTAGQGYFAEAHALFIMTARFDRTFWKYRDHPKGYTVLCLDLGHLSQTFYLVCAELGLGAFISAAIDATGVDDRLGLDGCLHGTIAVSGCGKPAAKDCALDPRFVAYAPCRTPDGRQVGESLAVSATTRRTGA